ncbi:hypothetical protein [Phaeobacter inhibens]|uniref:hypothetical protein n=1 Tax=Phaeobacter inhibens TaxID=221822 RepID=UPI00076BBDC7|nr:hypothetical protein [Phaeobacter inhibens]KXF91559.1 hypothetical protein AT574_06445 [Phaeobacter inhibens]WHP68833.1 hypothetical protein QMZ01_01200 [Phaeobacter inhibens]
MTRDEARARWAASGLTYEVLTTENIKGLRDRLSAALKPSGLIKGYRANPTPKLKVSAGRPWVQITCAAYYFSRREAVTFNPDGFVGFAGWADDHNVQPILTAFCSWVDDLTPSAAAAHST